MPADWFALRLNCGASARTKMRKHETQGKIRRGRGQPELNGCNIAEVHLLRKKKEVQPSRVEKRAKQ